MDLAFTAEEEAFRAQVRAWLPDNIANHTRQAVINELPLPRAWHVEAHQALNRAGYAVPHWPVEWGGRDWSPTKRAILAFELDLFGCPKPLPFNTALIGPVIAAFGSQEQKERFLAPIANLDMWFCQGFSEPGAGSDLASLKTSARLDGDHWVVNGQKLWTTYAHEADWIFCLVRTSQHERKQQGISFLVMPMDTPGISVRPVPTIDGYHHVNEVFFEDVRVPADHLIGEEGKGWDYARYLLGQERTSMGNVGFALRRLRRVRAIAGERLRDPHFLRRLTLAEIELKALEVTQMRVVAGSAAAGTGADPKTSILKIRGSEILQQAADLLVDCLGPDVMGAGFADPAHDVPFQGLDPQSAVLASLFSSRKYSIFGGTNEIQRNILAGSVLGLGRAK